MSKYYQQTFFSHIKNESPVVALIRAKLTVARLACLNNESDQTLRFINEADDALKNGLRSGLIKEQTP